MQREICQDRKCKKLLVREAELPGQPGVKLRENRPEVLMREADPQSPYFYFVSLVSNIICFSM